MSGIKCFSLSFAVLFCIIAGQLNAKEVSLDRAHQVAVNHYKTVMVQDMVAGKSIDPAKVKSVLSSPIQVVDTSTAKSYDVPVYHIINLDPDGWVIISADDVAYPIIAYSHTGYCSTEPEDMAPGFSDWMENVSAEICYAIDMKMKPLPEAIAAWEELIQEPSISIVDSKATKASSVAPLLTTTWDQGGKQYFEISNNPWNLFGVWFKSYDYYCPYETNWLGQYRVAPTGCVATAVGQVMRYWEWPPVGSGSHTSAPTGGIYTPDCSVSCTYDSYKVDYSQRRYNWSIMPNSVGYDGNGNPSPYEGGLEVARLLRDVGNAFDMEYNPTGSGASIGATELETYFRYDTAAVKKEKSNTANWGDLLRADLDAGRPVIYRGGAPSASVGHAFVCDGYDSSGAFHFNWGWSGSNNGYFYLSALTPGSYNFSDDQEAVFYLKPAYPDTVWVDDDYSSSGTNNSHIWGLDAFDTIQESIAIVREGGTVNVKPGTYLVSENSPLICPRDIKLLGSGASSTFIRVASIKTNAVIVGNQSSDAIIDGFTIMDGETTGNGAGILCVDSSLTISNCTFRNNYARGSGGAVAVTGSGSPTIIDCVIFGNYADSYGGGIFQSGSGTLIAYNCYFEDNLANYGGGWFNDKTKAAYLETCIFYRNDAQERGGALYNWENAYSTITNCVFYENESLNASKHDGALTNGAATAIISNSIFWANAPNQIAVGSTPEITNSIVQNGTGQSWFGSGCLADDPKFVNAHEGDFHLQLGSKTIDAGSNDTVTVATDYDGNTRIREANCDGIATVDMGVFEYIHTYVSGDCNCDLQVDIADLGWLAEHWLNANCGVCDGVDLNGDKRVNIKDIAVLSSNWLQ